MRANERETDTATNTATDTVSDTTTTDGPTQRDRESERETGGVRRAAAGGRRLADRRRRRYKTGHSGRHRTAKSGERRRLVCDSAHYKGAETAIFCFFSASVPWWGLFKSILCFFCVVLGRRGSRSWGYFDAKMRGSWRTAKSDRSKAALIPNVSWESCQLAAHTRVGRSVGREDRPSQWGVIHES